MRRDQYPLYIVDDEAEVLESMTFMLESYGYQIEAFNRGQAFLDVIEFDQVGCVLLDSRMPEMRGQEVHEILNRHQSPLSVIYLTGHGDVPMAVDALKNGAVDFFQKPVDGDNLVDVIDKAMVVSQARFEEFKESRLLDALTQREKEVLELLVSGLKNQQMADELCVSLRTIEVHRSNIMKKLGVSNIAALIKRVAHIL